MIVQKLYVGSKSCIQAHHSQSYGTFWGWNLQDKIADKNPAAKSTIVKNKKNNQKNIHINSVAP